MISWHQRLCRIASRNFLCKKCDFMFRAPGSLNPIHARSFVSETCTSLSAFDFSTAQPHQQKNEFKQFIFLSLKFDVIFAIFEGNWGLMLVVSSQVQAVCIQNLPCMLNNRLLAFAQKTKRALQFPVPGPASFRTLVRCGWVLLSCGSKHYVSWVSVVCFATYF